nr:protein DMR6-like oxygenase 2-like isoform X1 [Tanacetum cinerariifolium]
MLKPSLPIYRSLKHRLKADEVLMQPDGIAGESWDTRDFDQRDNGCLEAVVFLIPLDSTVASMMLSKLKTCYGEKFFGSLLILIFIVLTNHRASVKLHRINYCPFLLDFDLACGLMPRIDHDVLTLLYENDVPGLEVFHNEKWVVMSGVPNAFLVLKADHFEIFSNGVSKSKLHRAVVEDECK